MEVSLVCYWRNKTTRGHLRATIKTTVPMKSLVACPRVASRIEGGGGRVTAQNRDGCLEQLLVGTRTVWFMGATGVHHSKARSITRNSQQYRRRFDLKNVDHPSFWRTPEGVLFMANEPYVTYDSGPWDQFAQVCLPKGYGMWYPPATTLFLLAKPEHGYFIERTRDQLLAAGPPPVPEVEEHEELCPRYAANDG